MGFEAELRAYLEGIAQGQPAARPTRYRYRRIDEDQLRLHLLHRLRESDRERWARVTHERWSQRIAPFARYLEILPAGVAPVDPDEAAAFACRALDCKIGCLPDATPLIERLELGRVVAGFSGFVCGDPALFDVAAYAIENNLVRRGSAHDLQLTAIGGGFLRLHGKDAVRWLLTLEVSRSKGIWDPFRASHELLGVALSMPIETFIVDDHRMYPYERRTLWRLESLGVLTGISEHRDSFDLVDAMRDVVEAALTDGPWHRVIAAVIEDERAAAVPGFAPNATDAAMEQTKLVAHEVRNALVPARIQLEALRSAVPESQVSRVDAAKRGVTRVLTFVEEMIATSELVAELATSCDLAALIPEAIGWVEGGERISVVASPSVRVRAPRTQLARAISNLLRNALQATQETQVVRIATHHLGGVARVVVDDAGPGVPDEARELVFQEGYTTRTDGSGYGLAYVRRVVADVLRGRVWCETSDLGGARFVIELPGIEPNR